MNMRPLLDGFTRRLAQTWKFAVLLSEERDFIFGDGFFQSFPTTVLVIRNRDASCRLRRR